MSVPTVFGDITVEEQVSDLRSYFKNLGADISEERSTKGVEDDVLKIINVCDICFAESNESEIESVLNSIVSLLVLITERPENYILPFCDKLNKGSGQGNGTVALKALWLLFQTLDERSVIRYHVYCNIVKIARQVDMVRSVFRDIPHLKEQFSQLSLSNEQMQKLLRLLHDALLSGKQCDMAAKIMTELLSTYTSENANKAKDDARKCIVAALIDPNTFLLDPLLSLKPIKALEGEPIYKLLNIFVSDKLSTYLQFHKGNKEFVDKLGLNHEQNIKKMRILTFMQLAEHSDEISFDVIQKELQIKEDEVEGFIIEVLKTKLVKARMHQPERKVNISSTMHRTFGRGQWQQLRDVLHNWKNNLATIDNTMHNVVQATANRKSNSITAV